MNTLVLTELLYIFCVEKTVLNFFSVRFFQIILTLILVKVLHKDFSKIGLNNCVNSFYKGVIWSVSTLAICSLLLYILNFFNINPFSLHNIQLPEEDLNFFLFSVTICLTAPFYEEIVFRGVLFKSLRSKGLITAVTISTLIFSASHLINGTLSIVNIFGGILFALAFEYENNIITPFTIHAVGNGVLLIMYYCQTG